MSRNSEPPFGERIYLAGGNRVTPKRAGRPIALWHFKQVEQRLTADPFQAVAEVDLAAHAGKRQPPGISRLCRSRLRRLASCL
jgi:hypothetical protein